MARPRAILFDVDGTLISTGGAGARSWRYAFQELHGIPADIGQFTDAGMTDPTVARLTFKAAVGHDPTPRELATVMAAYLDRIPYEVEHSEKYRVLDGADELLRRLGREKGVLLGEALDPKQVLVVGDTPKDLDAAHGAGCVAVGVATGHYTSEQLSDAGADVVLGSLLEEFPGV